MDIRPWNANRTLPGTLVGERPGSARPPPLLIVNPFPQAVDRPSCRGSIRNGKIEQTIKPRDDHQADTVPGAPGVGEPSLARSRAQQV